MLHIRYFSAFSVGTVFFSRDKSNSTLSDDISAKRTGPKYRWRLVQVNNHNLIDEWEVGNKQIRCRVLQLVFVVWATARVFSLALVWIGGSQEEEVQVPRSRRAPRAVPAAGVRKRWRRRSRSGDRGAIAERARAGPRKRSAGGGPAGGWQRRMGRKGRLPPGCRRASNRREPLLLVVEFGGRPHLNRNSRKDEDREACSHSATAGLYSNLYLWQQSSDPKAKAKIISFCHFIINHELFVFF